MVINSKYVLLTLILTAFLGFQYSFSQTNTFSVTIASYSTLTNDEFSPVYFGDGVVFCSNSRNNSLLTYEGSNGKLFNIFFVNNKDKVKWSRPNLFAKELTTNYNDGPVTFNDEGNKIFFSRNNEFDIVLRNTSDSSNRIGIYSAELVDGVWVNIKPFEHNNNFYSFLTPALTPDGQRLYFASDMPGGHGGIDLYYSNWTQEGWTKPVNLGLNVNTQGNESFPFACSSGKLFFASDGHGGYGGKDVFYTQQVNGEWIKPIHLDAEINSPHDDFGFVTDEFFQEGYLSSNRRGKDDIYEFKVNPIEFSQCDSMVSNQYCFLFYDEHVNENDSIPVVYEWHFSEGKVKKGLRVKHCFPGHGSYDVHLLIRDSVIADSIYGSTSYAFELKDIEQVYIDSPDALIVDSLITFSGLKTNLPGFQVSDYLWDFGDGFTNRGPSIKKSFDKKGEYIVKLGLLSEKDSLGNFSKQCVFKRIRVFEDYQELATTFSPTIDDVATFYSDVVDNEQGIGLFNQTEDEKLGNKDPDSKSFDLRVYLLDNLTDLQRQLIIGKLHGVKDSTFVIGVNGFDGFSKHLLNTFAEILHSDKSLGLEVAVHSNERSFARRNQERTEDWAGLITQFFLSKGIPNQNVNSTGFGNSRPLKDDGIKSDSVLKISRIEFVLLKK